MLEEILKERPLYLGTPRYFTDLLNKLNSNPEFAWTRNILADSLRVTNYKYPYMNGAIDFLMWLDVLQEEDESIKLNIAEENFSLQKTTKMTRATVSSKLRDEGVTDLMFPNNKIYIDSITGAFMIDSVKLKYQPLLRFLLDFGLLSERKSEDQLSTRGYIFESEQLLPRRKPSGDTPKTSITLADLKKKIEAQEAAGRKAEEYVLNYEKNRIEDSSLSQKISMISDINASAGYDILSCKSNESTKLDLFIEVKSYSSSQVSTPSFYWTKNEIETAKHHPDNYVVYLVDRDMMGAKNYKPTVLRNTYKNIIEGEGWIVDPQVWKLTKI